MKRLRNLSRKRTIVLIGTFLVVLFLTYNFLYSMLYGNLTVKYTVQVIKPDKLEVYYTNGNAKSPFDETHKFEFTFDEESKDFRTIHYNIDSNRLFPIRLDLGEGKNKVIAIKSLEISSMFKKKVFTPAYLADHMDMEGITSKSVKNDTLYVNIKGKDPHISAATLDYSTDVNHKLLLALTCLISVIVSLIMMALISVSVVKNFLKDTVLNRKLILNLSKNDFKTKYAGSYFGIIWAFIQPIVIILLYTIVFQVGFKALDVGSTPYVLWLVSGLIPWFYFSDAVMSSCNSLVEYSYLVKKVMFNVNTLPIVKVISALYVHFFFMLLTVFMYALWGYFPNLYTLQIIYFSACIFILSVAIAYLSASIIVFFKDLGQIIGIILTIGMWATPILWEYHIIPEQYRFVFDLNPMFYVIEGYRDSLINKIWFWQKPVQFLIFWVMVAILFFVGTSIFRKLKPHFADVL